MKTIKFLILIISLTEFNYTAFTQEVDENKLDVSIQINNPINNVQGWIDIDYGAFHDFIVKQKSYSLGATFGLNLNDESRTKLRFRLGYSRIHVNEFGGIYSGFIYDSVFVSGKQNQFHFAPGVIWNIKNKKISFFSGFEIPFNLYQVYKLNFYTEQQHIFYPMNIDSASSVANIPKGISFGFGGLFGFSYSINKRLSIGSELAPSLLFFRIGGLRNSYILNSPNILYITNGRKSGITVFQTRFSLNLVFQIGN